MSSKDLPYVRRSYREDTKTPPLIEIKGGVEATSGNSIHTPLSHLLKCTKEERGMFIELIEWLFRFGCPGGWQ
jgi:hypothetical protein